jgi:hypothetical protein
MDDKDGQANTAALIVAADPKPWHGKMVYTRVTASVPAIGWYEVYHKGLLPLSQSLPRRRSRARAQATRAPVVSGCLAGRTAAIRQPSTGPGTGNAPRMTGRPGGAAMH